MKYIIVLFGLSFFSCSSVKTITGIAQNYYCTAAVFDSSNKLYIVDGIGSWEEKILDKKIVVSGKIEHKKVLKAQGKCGELSKAFGINTGPKLPVIINSQWKLEE